MAIKSSVIVAAVVALAGCSGDGGRSGSSKYDWDSTSDVGAGDVAIKLSYFRFDPNPDAKNNLTRWKPAYKYMLSQGWMVKKGPSPHEPFERNWGRIAFAGFNIHDRRMAAIVEELDNAGMKELVETSLAQVNLEQIKRIEQTGDGEAAKRTRIFTVEVEGVRRSYAYADNSAPGQAEKFSKVERIVVIHVYGNTVGVSKETQSTMPRGKN